MLIWSEGTLNVARAAVLYLQSGFELTAVSNRSFEWLAYCGRDLVHLIRARVGSYVTAYRTRHIDSSEGLCAFCGAGSRETIAHVLVECSAWQQLRMALLMPLIRQATQLLHGHAPRVRATPTNVMCLLLGGAASGVRLPHWSGLSDGSDDDSSAVSDDLSLSSDVGSDASPDSPSQSTPPCYAVARFLSRVAAARRLQLAAAAVQP